LTLKSRKKRRNSRSLMLRSVRWKRNCVKNSFAVTANKVLVEVAAVAAAAARKAAVQRRQIREILGN